MTHRFSAPTSRGLEPVLAQELREIGLSEVHEGRGVVYFSGPLEAGYRACLWSRVASRVLLELRRFPAPDAGALYEGARGVRWCDHIGPDDTLAVDFVGSSEELRHSGYAARKVKDAIVDTVRERMGRRPGVNLEAPDVLVHVHLGRDGATASIDLSGPGLHRRGGLEAGGPAPLKETLAAALLRLAGWPEVAANGGWLVDPMCGSGTFLREGAGIARDVAPGLRREAWGFARWRGHEAGTWRRLLEEAHARDAAARGRALRICGSDHHPGAVASTRANLTALGFRSVRVEQAALVDARAPGDTGLFVANPPYGERLGRDELAELEALYRQLGDTLRHHFLGWTGYVLTARKDLAKRVGLKPARRHEVWNGRLECRWLSYPISAAAPERADGPAWRS